VDRCRLIVHMVDVSGSEGRDPIEDFETISAELAKYSPALAERPVIVAANKCDIADEASLKKFREYIAGRGLRCFEISAAAHTGVRQLTQAIAAELTCLPPVTVFEPDYAEPEFGPAIDGEPEITRCGDVWIIEGGWLERIVRNTNFSDYESRMFFDRSLSRYGLYDRLEEMGISEGDTVSIYDLEFEYKR